MTFKALVAKLSFNGHPPLGVNATLETTQTSTTNLGSFNGHPPLGVNATRHEIERLAFQLFPFQWAPTLGGECYGRSARDELGRPGSGFNGHPPLGVNATGGTLPPRA